MLWKKTILGVGVTDAKEEDILEYVFHVLKKTDKKAYIVTPNPEIVVYAQSHPSFKNILNTADIALCDGTGIVLASYLLHNPIKSRVTGVDFMKKICEKSAKESVTVGFLGGKDGVAERVRDRLTKEFPGLQVQFAESEWGTNTSHETYMSNKSSYVDFLFVAFGHPKQEEWISSHLADLPVRVMMGVGGAFDYISGEVPRAPAILRTIGLEWLYRLIRQPWRWRRQLSLVVFIFLVCKNAIFPSPGHRR
jgi:N-acetylglucosaminyldiphosphoundecaprenol N-acetyl-beta-D-mannosaminyltransferase